MSERRWFNANLPQTLYIAQFLLYIDAFFMALGIVFSLALGGGLMALVFFSARRGYDDAPASGERGDEGR